MIRPWVYPGEILNSLYLLTAYRVTMEGFAMFALDDVPVSEFSVSISEWRFNSRIAFPFQNAVYISEL